MPPEPPAILRLHPSDGTTSRPAEAADAPYFSLQAFTALYMKAR